MSHVDCRMALCVVAALLLFWLVLHLVSSCSSGAGTLPTSNQFRMFLKNGKVYTYGRNTSLIFIGGAPHSGTTLMSAMLDAHPDIRCGQESHVIPVILEMRYRMRFHKENLSLKEAGVTKEILNSAIAAFALEIMALQGDPAARLCNKDLFIFRSATFLAELFPEAKFIFMVRDGRATVHSIISRQMSMKGFRCNNYRNCLENWNGDITAMYSQCREIGPSRCLMVPYEQLVMHPRDWLEQILSYVDVSWDDSVLHHKDFINASSGVALSRVEFPTVEVAKPVNLDAPSKWVGNIPEDVVRDMARIAPMLSVLGYDPLANPPNYRSPVTTVA